MPCLAEVLADRLGIARRYARWPAGLQIDALSASRNRFDHMSERRSGATLQPGLPGAQVSVCRHGEPRR